MALKNPACRLSDVSTNVIDLSSLSTYLFFGLGSPRTVLEASYERCVQVTINNFISYIFMYVQTLVSSTAVRPSHVQKNLPCKVEDTTFSYRGSFMLAQISLKLYKPKPKLLSPELPKPYICKA